MEPFTFRLQPQGGKPLYEQIYEYIAGELRTGRLRAGEKLPSKRVLAAHLHVSRNTVETAYGMLAAEGYVRAVPKSGFYALAVERPTSAPSRQTTATDVPPPALETYLYDFRTDTVDTSAFPYATWTKLSREIMADGARLLGRGDPQGDLPLRRAIAKYLHEFRGVNCSAAQIVVGAGIEYLIGLTAQLLQGMGAVALENPGYKRTGQIICNSGGSVVYLPMDDAGLRADRLPESGVCAVYITPSHQFPTGIVMPIGRRMELLGWACRAPGRYIIEDDYDSEFRYAGRPIPALQGLDSHGCVIYLGTFSKCIAPSIRVAYLVLPAPLLVRWREKFGAYSSTVSRFEQQTLARFLSEGHFGRHLNRTRLVYRRQRTQLLQALSREGIPFEVPGGRAGVHLLLRVKNGMQQAELVRRAAACGVRVYGLSEYCVQPVENLPKDAVVLGYAGFSAADFDRAAALLGRAWKVHSKTSDTSVDFPSSGE